MTTSETQSERQLRIEIARRSVAAFARDSAVLRDVGPDVAMAARQAYWAARQKGVDDAQMEALMTQAHDDTPGLLRIALAGDDREDVKRGIAWDVGAGLLPAGVLIIALATAAAWMGSVVTLHQVAAVAAVMFVLAVAAAALAFGRFSKGSFGARLRSLAGGPGSPVLTGSVGALFLGVFVVGLGGAQLSSYTKQQHEVLVQAQALEQRKVDTGIALTLAALRAETEPARATELVESRIGVGWKVESLSPSVGAVMARAQLRDGEGVITYSKTTGERSGVLEYRLISAVRPSTQKRYYFGTVAPTTDVGVLRLTLKTGETTTFRLPPGTLPPVPGAEVVVSERENGELASVQTVDGVVQSLLAQRSAPAQIAVQPQGQAK